MIIMCLGNSFSASNRSKRLDRVALGFICQGTENQSGGTNFQPGTAAMQVLDHKRSQSYNKAGKPSLNHDVCLKITEAPSGSCFCFVLDVSLTSSNIFKCIFILVCSNQGLCMIVFFRTWSKSWCQGQASWQFLVSSSFRLRGWPSDGHGSHVWGTFKVHPSRIFGQSAVILYHTIPSMSQSWVPKDWRQSKSPTMTNKTGPQVAKGRFRQNCYTQLGSTIQMPNIILLRTWVPKLGGTKCT